MVLLFFQDILGKYLRKNSKNIIFQSIFYHKKKVPCWGEYGTSTRLKYRRLFYIIFIHSLNKAFYQMMKICRPVFSLFHGYV